MKYRVVVTRDRDGAYVAECPALPGCVSEGSTRDEALTNIRDAIQGYLGNLKKHAEDAPQPIDEAFVEVSA